VSSYVVHWGDGNSNTYSTAGAKTHTYADGPNDYNITVDLTDEDGTFTNRANALSVHVNNVAPTITSPSNQSSNEGEYHSFNLGTFSDPGSDSPWMVSINWGDGSGVQMYSIPGSGAAANLAIGPKSHTYVDGPNDYTVSVTVTDKDTDSNTKTFSVHVNNVAPSVSLSGASSTNEGTTESYSYTFTDPGSLDSWTHSTSCGAHGIASNDTFSQATKSGSFKCTWPDNYTAEQVSATVTDNNGGAGTDTKSVNVANVAPAVTLTGPTSANEGDTKHYTYSWTDPSSADTFPSHAVSCGAHGSASNDVFTASSKTGSFDCTWNDDSGSGTADVTANVTDDDGGIGTDVKHVSVANVAPTVTLTGSTSANEGDTKHYSYSWTDPSSADTFTSQSISCGISGTASNAAFNSSAKTGSFDCTWNDDSGSGTADVTASVKDDDGGTGSDTKHVAVANLAPSVTITSPSFGSLYAKTATSNPTVTVTASFTDPGKADTHTCSISWDDGTTTPGTVSETPGSGSGTCTASHTYTAADVYTFTVTVSDDNGGASTATGEVVVYDASAGFVTGGGWIDVAAGSYLPNTSLSGRANFGFTAQYKKGATAPTGNTEFQFQVGNLNFHSENFNWLVVSGFKAQFKGTGTINGAGNYDFTLTAYDGDIGGNGQTGYDRFRIVITDHTTGTVVFDNRNGASMDMDAANPQNISGGSIVIHKA
jgi:uncharacterized protein YodC (DUF2158 family)